MNATITLVFDFDDLPVASREWVTVTRDKVEGDGATHQATLNVQIDRAALGEAVRAAVRAELANVLETLR